MKLSYILFAERKFNSLNSLLFIFIYGQFGSKEKTTIVSKDEDSPLTTSHVKWPVEYYP